MTTSAADPLGAPPQDTPVPAPLPATQTTAPIAAPMEDMVLSIPFNARDAALLDRVARMRLGILNTQQSVNLGEYIRRLINQDVAVCVAEIQNRRRA
mgnify:CR=1 FL=1